MVAAEAAAATHPPASSTIIDIIIIAIKAVANAIIAVMQWEAHNAAVRIVRVFQLVQSEHLQVVASRGQLQFRERVGSRFE